MAKKPENSSPDKTSPDQTSKDRRSFLKMAAGRAAALAAGAGAAQAHQTQMAMASPPAEPADVSDTPTEMITERPGSDFMVDVLKSIKFEYLASNPAPSFRALQESFINYGKNKNPEWITCM